MTLSLQDAVVVVTGAATGVGRALALEAAARGARVVVADITDPSDTVAAIEANGGQAAAAIADVTDPASLDELARFTVETYGRVDGIVNNAGAGVRGPLHEVAPDDAKRVFDVQIFGVYNGVRAFAPFRIEGAAAGRPAFVLNVGSEHSLGVPPHVAPSSVYTASKFATLGLTETASRDLTPLGIRVALLAPGWVRTENVLKVVRSSVEAAMAIEPYAQNPDVVARAAWDGLTDDDVLIIATNPQSRGFAMDHARAVMADIQRLPIVDDPMAAAHAHDGTGDPNKCPVVLSF